MLLTIYRSKVKQHAITGKMLLNNRPFCDTVERNGKEIPAGRYHVCLTMSPRFREILPLLIVPKRAGIRIHAGNLATDSEGCILVGEAYKDTQLRSSRSTLRRLIEEMKQSKEPIDIHIKDYNSEN